MLLILFFIDCCLFYKIVVVVVVQLKLVEEYMRCHKIPKELKVRVRNYFYHRYHGRLFNEKTMLKELSHVLEEVHIAPTL